MAYSGSLALKSAFTKRTCAHAECGTIPGQEHLWGHAYILRVIESMGYLGQACSLFSREEGGFWGEELLESQYHPDSDHVCSHAGILMTVTNYHGAGRCDFYFIFWGSYSPWC